MWQVLVAVVDDEVLDLRWTTIRKIYIIIFGSVRHEGHSANEVVHVPPHVQLYFYSRISTLHSIPHPEYSESRVCMSLDLIK